MKKYLKYKELSNEQRKILKNVNKNFDEKTTEVLYDSFTSILSSIENKDAIDIIKKLAIIKPIYSFQTIFDLMKEYCEENNELKEDFAKLKKYIEFDIDIFMLLNVIYS